MNSQWETGTLSVLQSRKLRHVLTRAVRTYRRTIQMDSTISCLNGCENGIHYTLPVIKARGPGDNEMPCQWWRSLRVFPTATVHVHCVRLHPFWFWCSWASLVNHRSTGQLCKIWPQLPNGSRIIRASWGVVHHNFTTLRKCFPHNHQRCENTIIFSPHSPLQV